MNAPGAGQVFEINYRPSPTLADFHTDRNTVRILMGPRNSGKSTGCVMEPNRLIALQPPDKNGIRRNKGVIVRNTLPDLKRTTITTWRKWWQGEVLGLISGQPPITQRLRWRLPDGTTAHLDVEFVGLDGDDDVAKLQSLETSWVYFNELDKISAQVFRQAILSSGRFPAKDEGAFHFGQCVFGDMNPPDMDHWTYKLFEESKPEGFRLFKQPPAAFKDHQGPIVGLEKTRYRLNPDAENIEHLADPNYYANAIRSMPDNEIAVYVLNEYAVVEAGRPVFTQYNDTWHFSSDPLPVYETLPLLFGMDFGRNPALLIAQYSQRGQLRCLDEVCAEDLDVESFIDDVMVPHMAQHYPGMTGHGWGDPSGAWGQQIGRNNVFDILRKRGFKIRPAPHPTNQFRPRKLMVDRFLNRAIAGDPGLLIGPKCRCLRSGMLGKYYFERVKVSEGRFRDEPEKNRYSDIQDALQALCCGVEGVRERKEPSAAAMARAREALRAPDRIAGA